MIVTLEPTGAFPPYIARYKGISSRGYSQLEAIDRLFNILQHGK